MFRTPTYDAHQIYSTNLNLPCWTSTLTIQNMPYNISVDKNVNEKIPIYKNISSIIFHRTWPRRNLLAEVDFLVSLYPESDSSWYHPTDLWASCTICEIPTYYKAIRTKFMWHLNHQGKSSLNMQAYACSLDAKLLQLHYQLCICIQSHTSHFLCSGRKGWIPHSGISTVDPVPHMVH